MKTLVGYRKTKNPFPRFGNQFPRIGNPILRLDQKWISARQGTQSDHDPDPWHKISRAKPFDLI